MRAAERNKNNDKNTNDDSIVNALGENVEDLLTLQNQVASQHLMKKLAEFIVREINLNRSDVNKTINEAVNHLAVDNKTEHIFGDDLCAIDPTYFLFVGEVKLLPLLRRTLKSMVTE